MGTLPYFFTDSKRMLNIVLRLFLFVLPWHTIWIIDERFVGGVKWEYGTIGFFFTEFVLWVCIFFFIKYYWETSSFQFRVSSFKLFFSKDRIFVLSCLVFVLYSFASALWAPFPDIALQQALHLLEALLIFFIVFLGPLPLGQILFWFILGSLLPSGLGIGQFLSQTAFATSIFGLTAHHAWELGASIISGYDIGRVLRAYGTFSHPNVFGGYLVLSIVASCLFLMTGKEKTGWKHVFVLVIFLVQTAALFFTFSRSAWIAAGIWAGVLVAYTLYQTTSALLRHSMMVPLFSACVLVSIFCVLFFPIVQTRVTRQSFHEQESVDQRVAGYREAVSLWRHAPVLGVGIGNYTAALRFAHPGRGISVYQPAHNVFLLFLAEFGSVGAILFASIIISAISYQLSANFERRNQLFVFLFLCTIPILPLLLFDHYLFSSFIGLVLMGLFAGVCAKYLGGLSTDRPQ